MRITIGWIFAAALISGCGGDVRARISIPVSGDAQGGNAGFEQYRRAALDIEEKASKYISRTAWTPDQRDFIVAASAGAIRSLSGIEGAQLGKTWNQPFGHREYTRGWRTIGRALTWRIDSAVKEEQYSDAVHSVKTAMRMANALASSDSHDAMMGLEIADECITSAWPHLPMMPAEDLSTLSSDIARLIEHAPNSVAVTGQERALLIAQVEWLRDRYQARDFEAIDETLGNAVEPAIKYLRGLAEEQAAEQQAFFTGLTDELTEELALFEHRLGTAPFRWREEDDRKTRPWMRFARSFGTPWRVYVSRRAEVRTRLRLFAIDAALLAQFKLSGEVPRNLKGFSKGLRTDPYSGNDFVFLSRGVDYKLYSVGLDGSDGGGDQGDLALGR